MEPGNNLYNWIEKIDNLLTGFKTLFLIKDIIANETLDKGRHPLLDLAISGRHKGHLLWLLTQSYSLPFLKILEDKQRCFTFGTQKLNRPKHYSQREWRHGNTRGTSEC